MHGTLAPITGLVAPRISRGKTWQNTSKHYVDVDELETGVKSPYAQTEEFLGRLAIATLEKHYPGHMWHAEANVKQGILQVKLISFSNWGEAIHIKNRLIPEIMKEVVRRGGDWLCRYGFPRRGLDVDDYRRNMAIWLPTWTRNLKPPD
jgi:hypothetical protein